MYLRPPKSKRKGKASSKPQKMPECKYGAACTRKGCIYRHPKKIESVSSSTVDNRRVCLAYLAELCPYGKNCMNRHPPIEEANELIYMFSQQLCRFGSSCRTEGCLYSHPQPEINPEASSNSSMSATATEWTPYGADRANSVFHVPTLVPQQWPKAEQNMSGSNWSAEAAKVATSENSSLLDSAAKQSRAKVQLLGVKSVVIPTEIWKDNRFRDPSIFHSILDPLARFSKVNEDSPDKCIDLHFISKKELIRVLDVVMPQFSYENNVWVITGSGHHRDGHQAEGVLFFSVVEYVKNLNLRFKIAKDSRGFRSGILLNPS